MLGPVKPEVLDVALGNRRLLGSNGRRVVRAELVRTDTAWGSPRVFCRAVKRDGLEALRVVRPDGAANDEEKCFFRRRNTQGGLSAD